MVKALIEYCQEFIGYLVNGKAGEQVNNYFQLKLLINNYLKMVRATLTIIQSILDITDIYLNALKIDIYKMQNLNLIWH